MAIPILQSMDFNQNELQNAVIQKLLSEPINPVSGQFYFDDQEGEKCLKIYNGKEWEIAGTMSAQQVFDLVKSLDGGSSDPTRGLNADTLDNKQAADFALATTGTEILKGDGTGNTESAVANDVVTMLGDVPVNRAISDADGNDITETYSPIDSPVFSGIPLAPTADVTTDSSQIATTSFVKRVVEDAGKESGEFGRISKIKNYLYEIWYDSIDYDGAYKYYQTKASVPISACSSVRNDSLFGRNFDWYYDNSAEFVVHVSSTSDRYASIGVAGGLSELTDEFVNSGVISDTYKLVPFQMRDGINEKGLAICVNVVPTDNGNNRSIPTGTSEVEICGTMIIRYLLDRFDNAFAAANYMREHMTIYFSNELHSINYELHFMIADDSDTYIVEFVDNSVVIINANSKPYMTNFLINGVTFNDDGLVYTPETQTSEYNAVDYNGVTEHGAGLERYNLIVANYNNTNTISGMLELLSELIYSRAYTTSESPSSPYWYTEFVGDYPLFDLTCASDIADFLPVIDIAGQNYLDRSRDNPITWHTTHSVVYDIANKKMYIAVQEEHLWQNFMVERISFSLDEWAAIQSGINTDTVYSINTHLTNNNIHVTNDEKGFWNSKQDYIPANTYDAYGTATQKVENHNSSLSAHASQFNAKADKATTYTKSEIATALSTKQDTIPENTYDIYGAASVVQGNLDVISAKIPSQASSSNQLADKSFVNSSVQTATANFRGNWDSWDDVPIDPSLYPIDYSGTKTPSANDYLVIVDASGYRTENPLIGTWRFKYSGVWSTDNKSGWRPEYQVNRTPLTAAQIAALNSNITSDKVFEYDTHIVNGGVHVTEIQKATWSAKQDAISPNTYDDYGAAATEISAHESDQEAHAELFSAIKPMFFGSISVSPTDWHTDTTYAEYPCRATLSCIGVTSDMYADVVFAPSELLRGCFAPICQTSVNSVFIYAQGIPAEPVIVSTIVAWEVR